MQVFIGVLFLFLRYNKKCQTQLISANKVPTSDFYVLLFHKYVYFSSVLSFVLPNILQNFLLSPITFIEVPL